MTANHWMTLISSALLLALALWLIRRGWARRTRRDADFPRLPAVPEALDGAEARYAAEAEYVSTTAAGDWLDRIASQGLGFKSRGQALVYPDGLIITRDGAEDLWIPAGNILALRREAGMAGKFVERNGLAVITWRLEDRTLDTGLRTRRADQTAPLLQALRGIAPDAADSLPQDPATPQTSTTDPSTLDTDDAADGSAATHGSERA